MLGKGGRVDQPDAFADGLGLFHRVLPPAAAPETARGLVVEPLGRKIIRTLPTVNLTELRAARLLPVIGGRGAQGAGRRTLFVRVVQDIDVFVGFLVLRDGVFGRHPAAEPFRVERGHVDLCLALDHQLREVVPRPACRRDSKGKAFGQPHISQARRRTDQRIAIRSVADRPVEIVLQPDLLGGRQAVDHRQILLLDPVEIQREEVGAETLRHAIGEARRRAALIGAEDPAAPFLAHVPFCVGVAQHGMFRAARLTVGDERGVGFGYDELMLHRDRRRLDP